MSSTAPSGTPLKARAAVAAIASTVLALVAVRLAWLGDDAYITLRTVESWAQGLGLRWNPTDRVQTYTHPLWMLTLACGRWLSGEVYFTTIGISLTLSLGAAWWLMIGARTAAAAAAIGAVLVSSRAFCDYTTSGLEVPLTAALLLAFVGNALSNRAPVRRYTAAVLLANLLTLNRMDLALLCLPCVSRPCAACSAPSWCAARSCRRRSSRGSRSRASTTCPSRSRPTPRRSASASPRAR